MIYRNLSWSEIKAEASLVQHRGVEGVPSCSDLPRLASCHGSRFASNGLSSKSSKWSEGGNVEHYLQYLGYCPLDAPDDVYYRFNKAREMVQKWLDDGYTVTSREQYMNLSYLTGTPDLVLVKDDRCEDFVILDFKFGFIKANALYQLYGYAHLWFEKYSSASSITLQVIQPERPFHNPVAVDRDEARTVVMDILNGQCKTLNPTVSNCQYCPAKGKCEATKYSYEVFINE